MTKEASNLTKRTLRGVTWSYVSAFVQATLRLGTMSVLAHLLLPRDFGLVGLALVFTAFAEQVGTLGVGMALVQRKDLSDDHYRAAANFTFFCSFAVYASLWLLAPFAAAFFREPGVIPLLRAVSVTFAIRGFGVVSENTLLKQLRFKELMYAEALAYAFGYGAVGICMAYQGFGPWSLVGAIISERIIKVAVLQRMAPRLPQFGFFYNETKELLGIGLGFMLGRLLNFGAIQGDNLMVGRILGAGELGVYGRSYQLMNLPAVYLGGVLNRVLFPAMSAKQDDTESLRRAYLNATEGLALLTFPLSILMFILSREIVLFLYGPQWEAVIPLLGILSLGVFFRTAYKNADAVSRGVGAVYRRALRQAIYAASVMGGTVIGATWGLTGVALGVLIAVTSNYVLMSALCLSLLELDAKRFVQSHLSGLWIAFLSYLACEPLAVLLRETEVASLGILILVTAVSVFVGGVSLLYPLPHVETRCLPLLTKLIPFQRLGRPGNFVKNRFEKINSRIRSREALRIAATTR